MNYTIKLLICLLIILVFSGCTITHKFGPFIGKVVDAETEEPIEGAAVHITFYTVSGSPGGASSSYAGSVECLTDKNGEFNLSRRIKKFRVLSFWDQEPIITIFKPGYGAFPEYKGTSISPHPHPGYIEEDQPCIVRLPKLKTKKERRQNMSYVSPMAPLEDKKIIRSLENQERIYLGLNPHKIPNSLKNK